MIGDVAAATAILDRFLQDGELIQITGKSYRLRGKSASEEDNDLKTGQTRSPGKGRKKTLEK